MNIADLNFIFKTRSVVKPITFQDFKSDSDSYEKLKGSQIKSLLEKRGTEIFRSEKLQDIALQEYIIESNLEQLNTTQTDTEKRVSSIDELIRTRLVDVKRKVDKSRDKVKQALLAEKKLVGETYTGIIPIEKDYATSNTTATIENGVILGIGYEDKNDKKVLLDLNTIHVLGEENTKFNIINEENKYPLVLNLERNLTNSYNQVGFVVPNTIKSGLLYIKLKTVEALSVLDKNGYEIVEKYLTDTIKLPVDLDTKQFSIRLVDNSKKRLEIESLYFTESTFNKVTVYESVPFGVYKDLSYVSVESCDNFASTDVDIKYEISLNGEEYQEYRPSGKIKGKAIQSIIKTDMYGFSDAIRLDDPILEDGVFKYYIEDPYTEYSKLRTFSVKLGTDIKSLEFFDEDKSIINFLLDEYNNPINQQKGAIRFIPSQGPVLDKDFLSLNLVVKKEFDFIFYDGLEIVLNGMTIRYEDTEEGKYKIRKGIHKLTVNRLDWKETVDLIEYKLLEIGEDYLKVMDYETGEEEKVSYVFNPSEKQFSSVFLQLWKQNIDMYVFEEVLKRKYDRTYVEYFYKDNPYPTYMYNESSSRLIETIQIKATMTPLSEKVSPYISKIIIRGI